MQSTLLSVIISQMNAFQDIEKVPEEFKVRQLDNALRALRRDTVFPWTLQQGTLKVFDDVLVYPVASAHDELAYLEDSKADSYAKKARFAYTSLQQFYEDNQSNRNQ